MIFLKRLHSSTQELMVNKLYFPTLVGYRRTTTRQETRESLNLRQNQKILEKNQKIRFVYNFKFGNVSRNVEVVCSSFLEHRCLHAGVHFNRGNFETTRRNLEF